MYNKSIYIIYMHIYINKNNYRYRVAQAAQYVRPLRIKRVKQAD